MGRTPRTQREEWGNREPGPKGSHEATRRNRNPASSDGYAVASPETGKGTASGRRGERASPGVTPTEAEGSRLGTRNALSGRGLTAKHALSPGAPGSKVAQRTQREIADPPSPKAMAGRLPFESLRALSMVEGRSERRKGTARHVESPAATFNPGAPGQRTAGTGGTAKRHGHEPCRGRRQACRARAD